MRGGETTRRPEEPALRNIRREAVVCAIAWVAAAAYCCLASYVLGYQRPDRPLARADVNPILGIPSWFFWGVIAPWAVFGVVNVWFALAFMKADDLGEDEAPALEQEIHAEASEDDHNTSGGVDG